jgi:hypothetical protein
MGETVRYAVGQPMGAYSSFACLALTHHVIVRVASQRAGVNPKRLLYAVLGDDGALANDKVAHYYREIFSQLGMKINPIKGFDGTVLEFAKQLWTINKYNISPLGAKNILLFIRNVEFLPSIIYELVLKRFPLFKLEKKSRRVFDALNKEQSKKGYQVKEINTDNLSFQDKFYMDRSRGANIASPAKPIEIIDLDADEYTSYRN